MAKRRKLSDEELRRANAILARIEKRSSPEAYQKEAQERLERAKALAREDERHYVDFLEDCVTHSKKALQDIRREQAECWRVFNEEEPPNFALKEPWQSRITVPKPFAAVKFAEGQVRKAFEYEFLSIESERNAEAAAFWQKLLYQQLGRSVGKFGIRMADATGMGLAVGTSLEIIPIWQPWRGLYFDLVEPWKIHRDPDAAARDPQSGMFWIHEEWIDWYVLKAQADKGKYQNVDDLKALTDGDFDAEGFTKEEIDRLKGLVWHRSNYRKLIRVYEFWGTILDKNGEILLENGTFTVAGNRLISPPRQSYFKYARWPGVSFSPIPHFLRHDGKGILHHVRRLWYFLCNLMSLHADNLNWMVNPMREVNIDALVDPNDTLFQPGKFIMTRETVAGQQVVREVGQRSITNEVIANANFALQAIDNGSFTTAPVTGGPGYRHEVTAREYMLAREQSLTPFAQIGKNIEDGAVAAIELAAETIALNITFDELLYFMGEEAKAYYDPNQVPMRVSLPSLSDCTFSVSGISTLLRDIEVLAAIRDNILAPLGNPVLQAKLAPYIRPYELMKAIEKRAGLKDEGILVDPEKAREIDAALQATQEGQLTLEQMKQQQMMAQMVQEPQPVPPYPPNTYIRGD